MKQILQSLKTGETYIEEIPCPNDDKRSLLIESSKSLVSAGTERMLLEFGKASLLGKIKQQPDKLKMVLDKVKTDGLSTTLNAIKDKLDQPIPLGYCNVGKVLSVGSDVDGFNINDRVVSNGAHAEVVRVGRNLCAKIPDNVSEETAVFTVLAAIGLQGIRLSEPTIGENYVVIGLGIIGLITVQLLLANGCRVLGVDLDGSRCQLAQQFGADTVNLGKGEDLYSYADTFSRGKGVDAVLITASTKSNEPLHQAATICRKRGRIVLIGVVGNEYSRADFFEKELSFQVSCSYGPGRYDANYEDKGQDYPLGFVRWTEQRNFEAVLDLMSSGALNLESLITHRYKIEQAIDAYKTLEESKQALGIVLSYDSKERAAKTLTSIQVNHQANATEQLNISFIGAGNYASRMLAPAFKNAGVNLYNIVSSKGISGKLTAKKLGFTQTSTDETSVYANSANDVTVIATRHNLHASQVVKALNAKQHTFVEKPLAVKLSELKLIEQAYKIATDSLLMVGFNRRFAPQIQTIKSLLDTECVPKAFIMTVNAGNIPMNHWTQDIEIGGGRIIGEACHFIDLLRYLAACKIVNWQVTSLKTSDALNDDKATILLTFADGSTGTIHYLANGHNAFPKERLEIICNGKMLMLDNFRKLKGLGWKSFKKQNLRKQNKGQNECVQAFVNAIKEGKASPIAYEELFEVSQITIEIAEYLRQ
tara:strand:- start:205757 stop:207874 length:2118 start_codon:yes stop_codon:yes gene_type:complete